jgi:hypothetical protein
VLLLLLLLLLSACTNNKTHQVQARPQLHARSDPYSLRPRRGTTRQPHIQNALAYP